MHFIKYMFFSSHGYLKGAICLICLEQGIVAWVGWSAGFIPLFQALFGPPQSFIHMNLFKKYLKI